MEIEILEECKYIHKKYTLDDLPESICLSAIIRNNEIIIPQFDTVLEISDKLLIFLKPESITKAENLFQ